MEFQLSEDCAGLSVMALSEPDLCDRPPYVGRIDEYDHSNNA